MRSIQHHINGQSVDIATRKTHVVLNPATEEQVAEIHHATLEEVNQAVAAAKAALSDWSEASIAHRTKLLYKFRNLVLENEHYIINYTFKDHQDFLHEIDIVFKKDKIDTMIQKFGFPSSLLKNKQNGIENAPTPDEVDYLNDEEVAEVHAIAGGKDGYEQLMEWAGNNLSEQDCKNFDEIVELGNKPAAMFAVKALMGQYEDAIGRDSRLIQGKKSSPKDVYKSMAQVVSDMSDPRYDKDEAYRDDVQEKLARSNLKV